MFADWTELYDPATGTFSWTGSLNIARSPRASLLNNGTVLIAGGDCDCSSVLLYRPLASAEVYDPATATFTLTGSMNRGRDGHTATLLNNGLVLITGGMVYLQGIDASAEVY